MIELPEAVPENVQVAAPSPAVKEITPLGETVAEERASSATLTMSSPSVASTAKEPPSVPDCREAWVNSSVPSKDAWLAGRSSKVPSTEYTPSTSGNGSSGSLLSPPQPRSAKVSSTPPIASRIRSPRGAVEEPLRPRGGLRLEGGHLCADWSALTIGAGCDSGRDFSVQTIRRGSFPPGQARVDAVQL